MRRRSPQYHSLLWRPLAGRSNRRAEDHQLPCVSRLDGFHLHLGPKFWRGRSLVTADAGAGTPPISERVTRHRPSQSRIGWFRLGTRAGTAARGRFGPLSATVEFFQRGPLGPLRVGRDAGVHEPGHRPEAASELEAGSGAAGFGSQEGGVASSLWDIAAIIAVRTRVKARLSKVNTTLSNRMDFYDTC